MFFMNCMKIRIYLRELERGQVDRRQMDKQTGTDKPKAYSFQLCWKTTNLSVNI